MNLSFWVTKTNKTLWSQQTEFKSWLCYFLCLNLRYCNIDPIYKIIKRINQVCLFRTSFSVSASAPPKGGFQNYKPQITMVPVCVQSFNAPNKKYSKQLIFEKQSAIWNQFFHVLKSKNDRHFPIHRSKKKWQHFLNLGIFCCIFFLKSFFPAREPESDQMNCWVSSTH